MISDIHAIIFSTAPTLDCRQDIISQAIYRHPGLPLNPFRSSRYQASEVGIYRTRSAFRATDRSIILQPEHNSFKRSTSNDTCRHFDFNFQKQSATTNNSNKRYRKRETLSLSSILLPPHYYPPRCIVDKQFFFSRVHQVSRGIIKISWNGGVDGNILFPRAARSDSPTDRGDRELRRTGWSAPDRTSWRYFHLS